MWFHLCLSRPPTEDVGWITEQVGPEICLFSTDFPHVEGGRRPVERFERNLGDATESVRSRFYAENFRDLMGRGLPAELANQA
jgi:predicted TIM-barrel fold metal-dependent hydrolase